MKQEVIDYIKGRITNAETTVSGDIETIYRATLDNGMTLEGKSTRPIEGFDQHEATHAAYEAAISRIYEGVAFTLNKV